jgi:hypothetical protein
MRALALSDVDDSPVGESLATVFVARTVPGSTFYVTP